MTKKKDVVGIDKIEGFQQPQRILVGIEFRIEVHVTKWSSLAVTAPWPLDPQCDESMPRQPPSNSRKSKRLSDRVVDREAGNPSLQQYHRRLSTIFDQRQILVHDMHDVEELSLVAVNPLHLYIEEGVRVRL